MYNLFIQVYEVVYLLIDVNKMRLLKTNNPEMRYKLVKQNIERFFRDYIYYYNVYDRKELIIDSVV